MTSDVATEWAERLTAVRRGWALILLLAIATAAAAVAASFRVPDHAQAVGRLIVAPNTEIEADFSISDTVRVLTQGGVLGTLAEMLESDSSLQRTAVELGLSPAELAEYEVSSQEVAGSMVLELHAVGPSPEVASALAEAVIEDATTLFDELYPVYEVRILDPVGVISGTTGPSRIQVGILGAVVGAFGGVVLILGWRQLRPAHASGTRPSSPPPRGRGRPPTSERAATDDATDDRTPERWAASGVRDRW